VSELQLQHVFVGLQVHAQVGEVRPTKYDPRR
jgi:hypothetical protein